MPRRNCFSLFAWFGSSSENHNLENQPLLQPDIPPDSGEPQRAVTLDVPHQRPPTKLPGLVIRSATEPSSTSFPNVSPLHHDSLSPILSRRASNASSRGRSNSSDSNIEQHFLKDQLYDSRVECQGSGSHLFIIPKDRLKKLVTHSAVVQDIRARNHNIQEVEAKQLATRVLSKPERSRRLYAILAYIKKGGDIGGLLNEAIYDSELPLVRVMPGERKFDLRRKDRETIKTFEAWSDKTLEKFDRMQLWITSPVFKLPHHHDLPQGTVLPFIRLKHHEQELKPKTGGYSRVFPVRIFPGHHDFWPTLTEDEEPLVAVKQLDSSDEDEFKKEQTILKHITTKNHPHLIKLLATYKLEEKYHLMFPFADANLRAYWADRPFPDFDKSVLWSVMQMKGMMCALNVIHNFKTTIPLTVPGPGELRLQQDVKLSVKKGEELFGRHGDIKPENILWFKKCKSTKNSLGDLRIADFGLGRFHGRDSRSKKKPYTVAASPTYEPPDCKLRRPVSRRYDIWSLGCVYLEFLTWLLKGNAKISEFAEARGSSDPMASISDDYFYTISLNRNEATVREAVVTWVEDLHADEKCSQVVHDILQLIMKQMLVVDSSDRSEASWLHQQLKGYLEHAEMDRRYLLQAVPYQRKPVNERSKSTPGGLAKSKPALKRPTISFADMKDGSPLPSHSHQKELDLVGRNAGTPGYRSPVHADTWPPAQLGR